MTNYDSRATGYHNLTRAERDHLLAAYQLEHDPHDLPNGQDIQGRVQELRGGERPGNTTTYNVLDSLEAIGWLQREHINDKATGFVVTHEGRETLQRALAAFEVDG